MLKLLIKKQLMEIFKEYFYDSKKGKARSKGSMIVWFAFYAFIVVGVLGGMFTALALGLVPLAGAGYAWLYFCIIGLISISLGAFGSIFNSYAGLYKAKDNELLLSMPIPVKDIVVSRLVSTYLMGVLYSAVVLVPAVVVYYISAGFEIGSFLCVLFWMFAISELILVLSCVLGYGVAKISMKLKNNNIIKVLTALLFMVLYYVVYFKAMDIIKDLLANAAVYGEKIYGSVRVLYEFGNAPTGNVLATGIFVLVSSALTVLVFYVLIRSFLKIATSSGGAKKKVYRARASTQKSVSRALLDKEIARFLGSANYMLNCGLGSVFMLFAAAALFFVDINTIQRVKSALPPSISGALPLFLFAFICALGSMCDAAAPSISLEGKNIWILQSMPVKTLDILHAKAKLQLVIMVPPALLLLISIIIRLRLSAFEAVVTVLLSMLYALFSALFGVYIGLQKPNLNWTNEIYPVKQNLGVAIALFSGWVFAAVYVGGYMWIGHKYIRIELYYLTGMLLLALLTVLIETWLKKRGTKVFESL